jgi:uncharacterized membrane protein YdjX (TVP38/TMEM64 family)
MVEKMAWICYNILMTLPIRTLLEYPKFLAFALCILLSTLLLESGFFEQFGESLSAHGYIAIFIAGLMFSFGFTAPFAVGLFLAMAHNVDIYSGALVGGFGAFLSDLFIFEFVRFSFHDEIHKFRSTDLYLFFHKLMHHEKMPPTLRTYLLWSVAGIVIASPFPDEISISLLSSVTDLDAKRFAVICLVLNMAGVFVMLAIGKATIG